MTEARRRGARVLLLAYALEGGALLVALGLYKLPPGPSPSAPLKAAACIALGGVVLVASLALMVRSVASRDSGRARAVALGLGANVWSLLLALAVEEGVARSVASSTPAGMAICGLRLLPTWPELAERSRAAIAGVNPSGSWDEAFLDHDPDLGWTVGRNQHDQTGRYFSSLEGIRSAGPDIRAGDRKSKYRVGLVGDSNAFSLEVPFAESWGAQLEERLGSDVQVLNFGVDGYGIDQMYLRYERDVRPWHPDVVLVGFIGHDLLRTMAVYPFVSFEWPGFVVKPRFTLEGGELRRLNEPLPDPEQILAANGIEELPYVDYDLGYATYDWRWRPAWSPILVRLYMSRSPRLRAPGPLVSQETTEELNRALFQKLRGAIERDGAAAIFVEMSDVGARDPLVDRTLAGTGIDLVDVTACLREVPKAERRTASTYHFTGLGNRAVASCTAEPVARALARSGGYSAGVETPLASTRSSHSSRQ